MIVSPEKKNSRFGFIVNPLLVLLYEMHFGFGIKPRHFSDRLIGSYDSQWYCIILGRQILIDHFNELWFIQKASKSRTTLSRVLALITSQKMLKERISYFYSINISMYAILKYVFILYFRPKIGKRIYS